MAASCTRTGRLIRTVRARWGQLESSYPDLALALRPPELPRRRAEHVTEVARQMALVGEARGIGDVRQGEIGPRQHLLGPLQPLLREVVVRRDAGGLLELPCEV